MANKEPKKKQNILTSLEKAVIVGGMAITIISGVFATKYLDKKAQQKNCETYGHLKRQPETSQRNYIMADLAKDNWGFKYEHPLGFADHVKTWTVNEILEDINNCQ